MMKRNSVQATNGDGGNGNGGGFMPIGRPGEFVSRRETSETESTLIWTQANIWIMSTIAIELCIVLICTLLALTFGGLWVVGIVVIVIASYVVFAVMSNLIRHDEPEGLVEILAPYLIMLAVDTAIYFAWPGFVESLEPKTRWMLLATCIVACLCGSIVAPYRSLATTMRYKILDFFPQQATTVPFQAGQTTPEEAARWVRAMHGDDPDGKTDNAAIEKIEAMLENIGNKPVIKRDTVILENRKVGNGLHLSPDPGSGDKNIQDNDTATVEVDTREDGRATFHICEHGKQTRSVTIDTARYFVEKAWPDRLGTGMRAWAKRGISDTQQAVIRAMLEHYNLIQPANGDNRETITWLVTRDEALAEFDRLFAKSAE